MKLSQDRKKQLKSLAHKLKPIVLVGSKGLTETVHQEIDRALHDHELMKMRIASADRDLRLAMFTEICERHQAELVQQIGNVGVLYRKRTT